MFGNDYVREMHQQGSAKSYWTLFGSGQEYDLRESWDNGSDFTVPMLKRNFLDYVYNKLWTWSITLINNGENNRMS